MAQGQKQKNNKSSHLLSTTNYSQVDPDFPTKPTEEKSNGSSTGTRSLQGNSDGSPLEKSDDNSSHLSSTTNYSQVDPDVPTNGMVINRGLWRFPPHSGRELGLQLGATKNTYQHVQQPPGLL
jgi:hypothetical protein